MLTEKSQQTFLSKLIDALPLSVTWSVPVLNAAGELCDFEIQYANESGGVPFGIPRTELIGKRIFSDVTLAPAVRDLIWKQFITVYSTGGNLEFTYYDPLREKMLQVVRSRVDEGVLTLASNVTQSLTDQKALLEQTQLTAGILDASLNGVMTLRAERDSSGEIKKLVILDGNKRFEEIARLPISEAKGKSLTALFPDAANNGFFENACVVIETGKAWREVIRYQHHNRFGWYEVSVARLGDGCVVTYNDVTHMQEQQTRIQLQAMQFEGILHAAQTRILLLAPEFGADGMLRDATLQLANKAYADFKNSPVENLVGQKASVLFPPQHLATILAHYQTVWTTSDQVHFDLHCDEPGKIFWVDIYVTRLGDELLVTINDYTQKRVLQLELEQKILELERTNRSLEEFAFAASHDLKEPIRKVKFFAERLRQELAPEVNTDADRDFNRLDAATDRMRDLVDDLLLYAQVSLRPKMQDDVPLGTMIRGVLADLDHDVQALGAQFDIDDLPSVRGHHRQLSQLFQNLVGNAIKYHRPGVRPHITMRYSEVAGFETGASLGPEKAALRYHLIRICDNGIGFEASEAERIFQIFQRLHGNNEYRGTGVGLAIARKVAENHRGFIYAKPNEDYGACFFVGLPA